MESVEALISSIRPPWSCKLRSVLMDDVVRPDQWKEFSNVTAFGVVVENVAHHTILECLHLNPFHGLQQCTPSVRVGLQFSDFDAPQLPEGTTIGIESGFLSSTDPTILVMKRTSKLWFIPEFQSGMEWQVCNQFCGAFEGWMKAAEWCNFNKIFCIRQSISIDCDHEVMRMWSLQNQAEFRVASVPCDDFPKSDKLGFGLPVHEFSWANWCRFPVNLFFTASPPCQSWSAGGTSVGIECDNGFAFIQSLHTIKLIRPIFAAFECSDAVVQHVHFKVVKMFLSYAGYELLWSTISKYDSLAPMRRSRWLAVWVRSDVQIQMSSLSSSLTCVHRLSWDHPMHRIVVPEIFLHQLILSRHLLQIYGNCDFLPSSKRGKLGPNPSMSDILKARTLSADEVMPTLCAMYTQQHELSHNHLSKKGIFAPLIWQDDSFAFIDPVRFLSLLGMPAGLHAAVPSKVDVAFHQIGNAISVPQALMCLLVAFDSILRLQIDIKAVVLRCWNERVHSGNLFFLAFHEAFLFTTPFDLSSRISFDFGIEGHDECLVCDVQGSHDSFHVKPEWTVGTFAHKCGFHEIIRQGFLCQVDGKSVTWETLFHDIAGRELCILIGNSPLLLIHVQMPATQKWTQDETHIDDEVLLSCVIKAESNLLIRSVADEIQDTVAFDFPHDGPFDRCLVFSIACAKPRVLLLPKDANDASVTQSLGNLFPDHDSCGASWDECKSYPFSNVDRVFVVDFGADQSTGALVILTVNQIFHSCVCLPKGCLPINVAADLSLVCSRFLRNSCPEGIFNAQDFNYADWLEFECDTSLPAYGILNKAVDERLAHFEATCEAIALDEFAFALRLVKSESPDTILGPIVDARADDLDGILNIIRIAIRSIANQFEAGHRKVFFPFLIPNHWCAVEATLEIDHSIKFVAVGFPQTIVHQVLHFAKICLFAISNVVHTFTLPLCGFDGMCGWLILKRWFKLLDLSLPKEFELLKLDEKAIAVLDKFLPKHQSFSCIVAQKLVAFARSIRGAFLLNLAVCEPSTALRQSCPPWGRAAEDEDMSQKGDQKQSPQIPEDPWKNFDPWKTGTRACKWEDLKLPSDHPFVDATGKSIQQVHRHRLNNNVSGVAFVTRAVVSEMIKIKPQKPSALIIPASDKSIGNIQPPPKLEGPFEIVVEDSASGAVYKRQVLMIQITPLVRFQLPKPTYTATLAEVREIVIEIDSRFATKDTLSALAEKPLDTFKTKMIEQFPTAVSENTTVYAFRKFSPRGSDDSHLVFQVMCKLPCSKRAAVIERSGLGILTTRDFVPKGQSVDDLTVIPRFWSADRASHQEAVKATTGLEGFAGLIISKRGLAARSWVSKVGSLRQALIPNDERISELNLHTIPRHSLISTGWPVAINPCEVVKATHHAVGQAPVPTRCFRNQGVTSWLLAFQEPPKVFRFVVKFNSDIHEILLTEESAKQPLRYAKKESHKGSGQGSALQSSSPAQSSVAQPIDDGLGDRVSILEAKFQSFEKRQENVEQQLSTGFESLQNQLRQVLNAVNPGREKGPTGETPPPKFPRNG